MAQGQERSGSVSGGGVHQLHLEDACPRKFLYFPIHTVIFPGDIGEETQVVLDNVFVERIPTIRNPLSKWRALNPFKTHFAGEYKVFEAGTIFRAYVRCLRQKTLTPTEFIMAYSIY